MPAENQPAGAHRAGTNPEGLAGEQKAGREARLKEFDRRIRPQQALDAGVA